MRFIHGVFCVKIGFMRYLFLMLFLLTTIPVSADVTDGLVGWWKLNEGSGTSAVDSSGQGNTGTLTNGPTWVSGKRAQAVSFDGSDDYIQLPAQLIAIGNTFTFTAWIYFTGSLTTRYTVFGQENAASAFMFEVGQGPGSAGTGRVGSLYSGQVDADSVSGVLLVNTWTHIAYTKNGTGATSTIYINGRSVGLATNIGLTYSNSSGTKAIGRRSAASQVFSGSIDDVRLYNRVLTETEIKAIYMAGTPAAVINGNGKIENFRMN